MSNKKATAEYKGYTLEAHREKCQGGWDMLYWSIMQGDGEKASGLTSGEDTPEEMIGYLRNRVDAELASDAPWGKYPEDEEE